jgi:glycerophosphoryl diester phosphodiesterase
MPFTVVAHRGHQGRAPELTLDAFEAALSAGFNHIELDTQLTADGVCIVLHDEYLGRTIQGSGRVEVGQCLFTLWALKGFSLVPSQPRF